MAESTDITPKPKSSSSPKLAPNRTKDFGAAAAAADQEEKPDSPSSTLAEGDDESDSDGSSSSSTASSSPPPGGGPPRSTALSRSVSENHDGIETRRDPEMGEPIEEKTTTTTLYPDDPNLVTWTGPDDPDNPKTWAYSKKWRAVVIVSMFTFMSPLSSSLVAPSLTAIGDELGVPPGTEQALILSIFVLAYAIGPLLWVFFFCLSPLPSLPHAFRPGRRRLPSGMQLTSSRLADGVPCRNSTDASWSCR